ncbi:hypothetical protein [Frigoriglobus tundricola]|uniref:Tat pathway signal sequence domain protein n=1 Tax=Frigoriglobus tundricola TaxID=2774151 RepID=A0A6M5YWR7_9BACT|nr:hypothetical protein [Frigoriglobus tundricola]QJW97372.1 hypothetical protein FTUN_4946 [Frigoriglobus tundricola]
MSQVSRRRALGCVPAAVCTALSSSTNSAHAADKEAGNIILLGPFRIDGWFLKARETSPLGGPLQPLSTPKSEDVVKVLSGCQLYLLDRRIGADPKKARFADSDSVEVLMGGTISGEWKDGKKTFTLSVATAEAIAGGTSYKEGVLPTRGWGLNISIHLWGTDGQDTVQAIYHFSSDKPRLRYDITGTILTEPGPKPT